MYVLSKKAIEMKLNPYSHKFVAWMTEIDFMNANESEASWLLHCAELWLSCNTSQPPRPIRQNIVRRDNMHFPFLYLHFDL